MPVNAEQLSEFLDKRVVLHTINGDQSVTEREGKVEAASVHGIAFKEKGKGSVDLYEVAHIEEISAINEGPKKLRQKKLKPVEADSVRQHLVDRHGMPLTKANEIDDAAAAELHDKIDHTNLGHRHEAGEETTQEKAIADAETNAA